MSYVPIPLFVLIFALSILLLTGFVGICLGTPGNSRLKKSLIRFGVSWMFLITLDGTIQTTDYFDLVPPDWTMVFHALAFQLYMMVGAAMFYSIAEEKHGRLFWFSQAVCGGSMLAIPFVRELYLFDSDTRIVNSMISLFVIAVAILAALYKSFRQSAPDSNRRKRIRLIIIGASLSSFVVYLPWAVGETLGWWTNGRLVSGFMNLSIVFMISTILSVVILKYNLVRVELDELGEGLFRDIEAPVLLLSKEHNILRSNPKSDAVFGLDALMSRPEAERAVADFVPGFQPGQSQFDVEMDTLEGHKEFQCKLSAVYQVDEVLGSIVVFHDVTRERELARMKTEFTSTVSHELRTPLTSIMGFAKLIRRRFADVVMGSWTPESKKQQRVANRIDKNLEVIISESQRLTKLINDVLDISKMEAGKVDWNFAQVDAISFIDQAINATHGLFAAKPSVTLVRDIPSDLPQVVADPDRLVQVVINLISNAVKFTDAGEITIAVEKEWSSLTVRVLDQGTGISEADQKLVFQKYKQVGKVITDKPSGTGLGLPISKEIVEMHGGRIWVESVLGEGSTFAFSLPLATAEDTGVSMLEMKELIPQLDAMIDRPVSEGSTVLVVDDDAAIREMLVQLLEEAGHQVLEAADGVEGLEATRRNQPDVIILDLMMPRLNGFDCAAALKSDPLCRHIPIMMLTVLKEAQRAFGLGVEAYQTKPFDDQKVLSEVQRLLDKRKARRRLVVLGSTDESQAILEKLQQTAAQYHHVPTVSDFERLLTEQGADVALVVGSEFQQQDRRLEIQRIVGVKPCLVLYLDDATA